jgi:hypothetical protein
MQTCKTWKTAHVHDRLLALRVPRSTSKLDLPVVFDVHRAGNARRPHREEVLAQLLDGIGESDIIELEPVGGTYRQENVILTSCRDEKKVVIKV